MKFTMSKDRKNKWRWTMKSENGRIIGASTQGYSTKDACRKNAIRLGEVLTGAVFRSYD